MDQPFSYIDKLAKYLLVCILAGFILYFGQTLFIPVLYGLFVAIVLYPVCSWLEKHHFSRSFAITAGLLMVAVLFALLIWLLGMELKAIGKDLPELRSKISPGLRALQQWLANNFNISIAAQNDWWQHSLDKISGGFVGMLTGAFGKTVSSLFMLFITPVFSALFLYNRRDFVLALEKMAGKRYEDKLHGILRNTIHSYYQFVKGMILVYIIVGILNSIGLLLLGIEHAILFGFLTSIMTIIPYIGIMISALLPITVAWITKSSLLYPLGVIGVFTFVQYLEANVIFPRVVATQLNISTWATLVAIIGGGILWGVNGMILFIPFVGILKILTDYFPEMETLNILLRRKLK